MMFKVSRSMSKVSNFKTNELFKKNDKDFNEAATWDFKL